MPTQAFILDTFVNSATTDPLAKPAPDSGSVPAGWGTEGYEAWRTEWRIAIDPTPVAPTPPDMTPGTRVLRLKAAAQLGKSWPADNNPLTINIWDYAQSTITNAWVVITGFYTDSSGQTVECETPFSYYAWNCATWDADNPPLNKKSVGDGSTVVLNMATDGQTSFTLGSTPVIVDPDTSTGMYSGALITLLFDSDISAPATGVNTVAVAIDVYFTMAGKNFFDDPELEVDCGTGDGLAAAASA